MEQIQAVPVPASLPHIVQVYQTSHPLQTQGKVTYQQPITSESIHIPVSSHIQDISNQHLMTQNQTVVSCQPISLQNIHQSLQTQIPQQVLQSDLGQPIQITSHVILPQVPVFKQHLITNNIQHQYYGQYESYLKDSQCIVTKVDSDTSVLLDNVDDSKNENSQPVETDIVKVKRTRSQVPNPNKWACNVRKMKHQRGEAYINGRGKFVPERKVRNTKDCLRTCRFKCNGRINDVDQQHIFKAFYSLNSNEKKHFLLNTTERNEVKILNNNKRRKHSFKYFFLVRGVRHTVCKNFYLGTLSISQKPVYNVHMGKSDLNLPKPDGRGLSESSAHALPSAVKNRVRKHIMSFNTIDFKEIKQFSRKKQYLESGLSIKQMFSMYLMECDRDNVESVKESMYRKIFTQEFNLHFKREKAGQLCSRCKCTVNKK